MTSLVVLFSRTWTNKTMTRFYQSSYITILIDFPNTINKFLDEISFHKHLNTAETTISKVKTIAETIAQPQPPRNLIDRFYSYHILYRQKMKFTNCWFAQLVKHGQSRCQPTVFLAFGSVLRFPGKGPWDQLSILMASRQVTIDGLYQSCRLTGQRARFAIWKMTYCDQHTLSN